MPWIKLEDTFSGHYKLVRLSKKLGVGIPQAAGHLAILWTWALRYCPDGDVSAFGREEVEHYALWDGKPGKFYQSMVESRLIDITENGAEIHDWMDYAGAYINTIKRKKKHREKRKINNLEEKRDVPVPSRETQEGHTEGRGGDVVDKIRLEKNRSDQINGSLPNGKLLSRSEKSRDRSAVVHKHSDKKKSQVDAKRANYSQDVQEVYQHWRAYHPQAAPKLIAESPEYRLIADRLREGSSTEHLREAIDGCHKTPHNIGLNDRGKKYLGVKLIFRDASQVERFIENNRDPTIGSIVTERDLRNHQAGENFVRWAEGLEEGI